MEPSTSARTGKVRSKDKRLRWLRDKANAMVLAAKSMSQAADHNPSEMAIEEAYRKVIGSSQQLYAAIEDWKRDATN